MPVAMRKPPSSFGKLGEMVEKVTGPIPLVAGMVGGLPDGLNPTAIGMMLKALGINVAEETMPSVAGKAATDVANGGAKVAMQKAGQALQSTGPIRLQELYQKLGNGWDPAIIEQILGGR